MLEAAGSSPAAGGMAQAAPPVPSGVKTSSFIAAARADQWRPTLGASDSAWEARASASNALAGGRRAALVEEPPGEHCGPRRNQVHLLQLSPELMHHRDIDEGLLEFLTAPLSVQKLSPDVWLDVWQHVAEENWEWMEMRGDASCGPCPYCRICDRWAENSHLQSKACQSRRDVQGFKMGPVLTAILEAEGERVRAMKKTLVASHIGASVVEDCGRHS